jgi:hypothetical protein
MWCGAVYATATNSMMSTHVGSPGGWSHATDWSSEQLYSRPCVAASAPLSRIIGKRTPQWVREWHSAAYARDHAMVQFRFTRWYAHASSVILPLYRSGPTASHSTLATTSTLEMSTGPDPRIPAGNSLIRGQGWGELFPHRELNGPNPIPVGDHGGRDGMQAPVPAPRGDPTAR